MIPSIPEKMPELFAALATAQGAFPEIPKNRHVVIKPREGAAYTFDYADLQQILAAVRPALSANGLSIVQPVIPDEAGESWLVTALLHTSGAALVSRVPAPQPTADPKQYGGLLTFMRRYLLCSLLCIAADADLDDDGQERRDDETSGGYSPQASQRRVVQETDSAPARAQPQRLDDTTVISPGQLKNLKAKIDAAGLTPDVVMTMCIRLGVKNGVSDKMTIGEWKLVRADIDKVA